MDDFFVFGTSIYDCLAKLALVLERCKKTNLILNWEKYHNMNGEIRNVKRRLHSASSVNLQLSICHFCSVKANKRLTPVINIPFLSLAGKLVKSAVKSRF